MKNALSRLAAAAALAGLSVGVSRQIRQRRRHLALMPISVSTAAGMTFRRCRKQATLRQRSTLYETDEPLGRP
jgi:hypothetical protein